MVILCKVTFFPPKFPFQNTKEKFGGKKIYFVNVMKEVIFFELPWQKTLTI
jgi:hypothetical protein